VNKLLFSGGEDVGGLQLWNIMSNEQIFDFKEHIGENVVTCVEQSPVVDIVAIGLDNGEIILMNLLYNTVLLKFN
jgi:U3 small nucleolar RNA-associated protein 21